MKKRNMSLVMIFSLIILLILKLIFFDRNVLNIVLSASYLGFFLITLINFFRKKETSIQKNYLSIILVLLVIANFIQTGILLFSSKNIVNSLFYAIVFWMMLSGIRRILGKKEYAAKKVFIAAMVLVIIPGIGKFNLDLLINAVVSILIIWFFNNSKENYFGLFDSSYIDSGKERFKITQWIKTFVIVVVGILFLYFPVVGSILALIMGLLCISSFFDNLILVYEQSLFNKKVRKHKVFIASKKIYSFASSGEFLKKQLEVVAKKTFLEEGIPYETYAIMDVMSERKNENDNNISNEEVSNLFKNKVRPEVICKILVKLYAGKKKVIAKLEKCTTSFYDDYLKFVEDDRNVYEKVDEVTELYNKYCGDVKDIIS